MTIRISLLCLCLLLICFKAIPQSANNKIALLEKRISASKDDTGKVLLYLSITDIFSQYGHFEKALASAHHALALSAQLKYVHGIVISYVRVGSVIEVQKKDYLEALGYYKDAMMVAEAHHSYNDENYAYASVLNISYYLGDYPGAMIIAQKGLELAEQRNDNRELAHYYNQLGFIYLKQEKAAESLKYYTLYLSLATRLGDPTTLTDAYMAMADVYLLKKDYKTSLDYLFSAFNIYKKANIRDQAHKTGIIKADRVPYVLYKISNVYKLQGQYQLALQYAIDGLNYTDGRHRRSYNQYDLASYYINLGEIYAALNNYGSSMQFLHKGLALSKNILHREDMRDAYSALSKTYAKQQRYDSAYHYQQLYSTLKDSIISEKTSRAIEQVRSNFESEKKDKEIALLNQRQKLREAESGRKSLLLNIVIIFFTFLAIVSYLILYIRNNQKQHKQAYEKQLAIHAERQRISGDMHDDIGTGLSTMLIYVNMLKSKMNGMTEYPEIERVALLGDELVAQMKEIVWSLNPGNDSLENLLVFIRQYFSQLFEPLAYQTNLVFPAHIPDFELKGAIRRNIYLCIKEALNNVIKHAHANHVELNIQLDRAKLLISIKDNGSGFPGNLAGKPFSNGLKNMQSRMDQIGGGFKFFNNNGAVVSIEFKLTGYPNG